MVEIESFFGRGGVDVDKWIMAVDRESTMCGFNFPSFLIPISI